MAVGPVAARQSDRRDACCLIRDYLSGTEYQGPAAPVQWPGSKHATPGPSRGCQAGQRRAAATAPAGQVPLARCGHECAGPSDVGTKEMIAGQYWQNRARPSSPSPPPSHAACSTSTSTSPAPRHSTGNGQTGDAAGRPPPGNPTTPARPGITPRCSSRTALPAGRAGQLPLMP
jgi:hypothetical protein